MFLSKPVVSSNAGCCSELVSKNRSGFIYYTDNELEGILTNLIKNKTERKRLGDNGYTRFKQEHSEQNYQQYFNFFDSS
jgi:glycosyltransferase involved in cell wall biosynthesis